MVFQLATYLIDTSAYTRTIFPSVENRLRPLFESGAIAVTGVSMLEILFGAQSASSHRRYRASLGSFTRLAVTERIVDRALDIQFEMVSRGTHRAPSPADLILAACAEANGLTVLHYDKDFDLIAEVTDQPTEWVVPPGSV